MLCRHLSLRHPVAHAGLDEDLGGVVGVVGQLLPDILDDRAHGIWAA